MKAYLTVSVENGVMKIEGNVVIKERVGLLEAAKFLILSDLVHPARGPEGAPPAALAGANGQVARTPGFEPRTVA